MCKTDHPKQEAPWRELIETSTKYCQQIQSTNPSEDKEPDLIFCAEMERVMILEELQKSPATKFQQTWANQMYFVK